MTSKTEELAEFAANLRFGNLPVEVAHQSARVVYDTLTCAILGAHSATGKVYREAMLSMGGAAQATILGSRRRLPAPAAAFVNATLAHANDFDDNLLYHSHIANTVVADALAIAEHRGLDGRALLTAVVAGYEVAARVSLAMPGIIDFEVGPDSERRTFTPNPVPSGFNAIGGGVAAGHLLGLEPARTAYVIGLSAYSAPMPAMAKAMQRQQFTFTKPNLYGWQAWAGCLAALLVESGVDGDSTALDGPTGFWRMTGASQFFPESLTYGFGKKWWILDTSFKLEPAGTWMRPALRALRLAMKEGSVTPDQILSIDVFLRPLIAEKADAPSRYYKKQAETFLDAQVSYYYLLAVGALGIAPEKWQLEVTFRDPAVREMVDKIHLHADAQAEKDLQDEIFAWPHRATGTTTRVVVRSDRGEWSAQTRYGDGDPFDPETRATDEQLDEKFDRFAAPLLGPGQASKVSKAVWGLEAGLSTRALVSALH